MIDLMMPRYVVEPEYRVPGEEDTAPTVIDRWGEDGPRSYDSLDEAEGAWAAINAEWNSMLIIYVKDGDANKTQVRPVVPIGMFYGSTEHHQHEQWFFKAYALDRDIEPGKIEQAIRSFPLELIKAFDV